MKTLHFVTDLENLSAIEQVPATENFDFWNGSTPKLSKEDQAAREYFNDPAVMNKQTTAGGGGGDEYSEVIVIQRNGVYYITTDSYGLMDYDHNSGFVMWLLQRSAQDKLVIDPQGGTYAMAGELNVYRLMIAIANLGSVLMSPADITVRLNGQVAGISAYLALCAKQISVGHLGELVLGSVNGLFGSEQSKIYRHFIEQDLFGRAKERGLITKEEYDILLQGKQYVRIRREDLIARGCIEQ